MKITKNGLALLLAVLVLASAFALTVSSKDVAVDEEEIVVAMEESSTETEKQNTPETGTVANTAAPSEDKPDLTLKFPVLKNGGGTLNFYSLVDKFVKKMIKWVQGACGFVGGIMLEPIRWALSPFVKITLT